MSWHRGDYHRMRKHLTVALLEMESMEPRMQLAYSRGLVPAELTANLSLARLMLERADRLVRESLDQMIADTERFWNVYADTTYRDAALVEEAA